MNCNPKPLVSVLLPSYNHEHYVQAAIESVCKQTYQNIELIVIDDGSTDQSVEIISKLQEKYGFNFIKQENQGLIATLYKLGSLATGKYISNIASDDLYHPEKIEILVDYLEANDDFSMVYSRISIINSQSIFIKEVNEHYREGSIFFELLCGDFFINGVAALVRSDVYFSYERIDCYIEDLQLWLAIAKNHQIGFVDKVTAYYRIHNNHLSSDLVKMQKAEYEIIMQYSDVVNFSVVMNKWNLRWFKAFAPCHKLIAIQDYLMKNLLSKNLFSLSFLKGVIRLFLTCKF